MIRKFEGTGDLLVFPVHARLWYFVKQHCKENGMSVSYLLDVLAREYINNPFTPEFNPDRRILPFTKISLFYKEFPEVNTSLFINRHNFARLINKMKIMAQVVYPNVEIVRTSSAVNLLLFNYSKTVGYPSNDLFFSNDYFNVNYSVTKESIIKNLHDLQLILGHPVTARLYSKHRNDERILGPSLSVIINMFGTFNKAKSCLS